MFRTSVLIACAGALLPCAAFAGDDSVQAQLAWEGRAVAACRAGLVPLSDAPPAEMAPPRGALAPRYGSVALPGGGALAFAADTGVGHERVWVDRDLDGRLDDEQPVAWTRGGVRSSVSVTVHAPRAAGGPVPVGVELMRAPFRRALTVRARAGCQRWGAVVLAGALRQVALHDGDGDLRFDGEADRVYVDVNRDGSFDTGAASAEAFVPGSIVRLGSVSYRAAVEDVELRFGPPTRLPGARRTASDPEARASRAQDLDALVGFVEDPGAGSIDARAALVSRVGAIDSPAAHQYLVRLVRSSADARLRAAAVDALAGGAYGRKELLFVDALAAHPVVARRAARRLLELGTAAARAAVVQHVRGLPDAAVRTAVYRGAREAPGGPPEQAALAAATDDHAPLRALGITDLFRAGDARVRSLALRAATASAHPDLVRALPPVLAARGDPEAVDALFLLARAPDGRETVLDALAGLRESAGVSHAMDKLRAEHAEIRGFAAEALGHMPASRISSALLEALGREREPEVRQAVLDALGERAEERTIRALEALAGAPSRETRAFAFEALGSPALRGRADVRAILDSALHGSLRGNRVLAVRAVVSSGDVRLLGRVRQALGDEYRLTRLVAAEALGELRQRDSVRPLIDRLAAETNPRLRAAVARSLFRLTGVNLYDDAALWEQWWSEQGASFAMPARPPVLPDGERGKTRALHPPKFYGIPVDSDGIVFVIDQSGSMGEGPGAFGGGRARRGHAKFDVAVAELLTAVGGLHDGAGVNVVLFESTVRPWARSLQPLSPRVREVLKGHLESQTPTGETNLFDALRRALLMEDVETIVVLSDGAPTAGRYVEEAQILGAVEQLNARREIVIHCVSVGTSSSLLRRLAARNGGQYARR